MVDNALRITTTRASRLNLFPDSIFKSLEDHSLWHFGIEKPSQ